ncbi:hypothetical protein GCM10010124_02480 [Pilimelia terevasa]|uniref:Uncharacterized protein n=1 Tax=Pilimelia terevasa TaxID=53372 RepID=A0A8J3BGK2_9ACTN|nr:thiopeptide-type bacteriocin biosynthesis protein [Pilimelia terevasa]GGK13436.1 hypothetical protein GCM10010124_02480 [Pilimelia terevasa]
MTPDDVRLGAAGQVTEPIVLAAISGGDLTELAAEAGVGPDTIRAAVKRYRSAGRTALQDLEGTAWRQVDITFTDRAGAERTAADVPAPALAREIEAGTVTAWWFIRKGDWRLRIKPADPADPYGCTEFLDALLGELVAGGGVRAWRESNYEPETFAFGGPPAMTVAHNLFFADSRHLLAYLRGPHQQPIGRPELTMLMCSYLLRSAGLEWHEQGDVWSRVASYRDGGFPEIIDHNFCLAVRRLITVDAGPASSLARCGPLAPIANWLVEFGQAGARLRTMTNHGSLGRGLRAVLSTHILFHWNRLGIPFAIQHRLATSAAYCILGVRSRQPAIGE